MLTLWPLWLGVAGNFTHPSTHPAIHPSIHSSTHSFPAHIYYCLLCAGRKGFSGYPGRLQPSRAMFQGLLRLSNSSSSCAFLLGLVTGR